jgi:hypothetical protein
MSLLLLGIFLSVSFVSFVHYIVRPLVKMTYDKYEPLWFHYNYKLRKRVEKTWRKVREKSLKSWVKVRYFYK